MEEFRKLEAYTIYAGLNDADTFSQKISFEDIAELIGTYFLNKEVGFSLVRQSGGFRHENGTFVNEESFAITLIGSIHEDVEGLASRLKEYLNQELVIIERKDMEAMYL